MSSKFDNMTFGQKLEHFWFYYKWHTLAVIFAVVALTVCFVQCSSEESADCTVGVYMDRQFTGTETADLAAALTEYCEDINGDGKVVVKIYDYSYLETQKNELQMINKEKLMTELTGGSCVLYLTDEYRKGFFDKRDIPLETEYGRYVTFNEDNELLKKLRSLGFSEPENILAFVRKTDGTMFEKNNANVEELEKNALNILKEIAK